MTNTLSPHRLLDEVTQQTGLDDFGADRFTSDFTAALDGIMAEVALSPAGVAATDEWVRRTLRNRLVMTRDITKHPEIAELPVTPPLVITGVPRTGTTKLQRMVSADPGMRGLAFWKLLNPAPLPGADPQEPDPRIAFAQGVEEMIRTTAPAVWAGHPTPALDVEEDLHLHELTFTGPTLAMRIGAPRLLDELTPVEPYMYEYTRLALQYLQWQEGPGAAAPRPWVLKSPIHIGNLDTLIQVFPDAVIVHCHRDIETSMASTARLIEVARHLYSDRVDRTALGTEVLEYWAAEWRRNIAARPTVGARCLDVRFEDICDDPFAVVRQMYALAGREFTDEGRAAMELWDANNKRHSEGRHAYDPADYGYTTERVRTVFADYIEHFGA